MVCSMSRSGVSGAGYPAEPVVVNRHHANETKAAYKTTEFLA